MAYDLEEQEQLATLKGWWKDNGGKLVGALLAVALAASGWQGWRVWQASRAAEAGQQYEALVQAIQAGDAKAVRDAGGTLICVDHHRGDASMRHLQHLLEVRHHAASRNTSDHRHCRRNTATAAAPSLGGAASLRNALMAVVTSGPLGAWPLWG